MAAKKSIPPTTRADDIAAEWVEIKALTPWKKNPRRNDDNVKRVMESIKRFGFSAPIIARRADGEVIAGHTRLKAAEALGITRVPVRYMDLDPADAHLLALADNRLNELSPWDTAELTSILSEYGLESAALAGWSSDDLDKMGAELLAGAGSEPGEVVEDEVPEPPKVAITKPGDVWELGEHRLLCGDCTTPGNMAKLMGSDRAALVFTDPPYNCADEMSESFYAGTNSPAMKELSDTAWDKGFDIGKFLAVLGEWAPKNGSVYVCTSHMLAPDIWAWMKASKASHSSYVVWCKPNPMPSLMKRHPTWATELICYATFGKHTFNFPDEGHALSWWALNKNAANTLHPTQKPVAVPAEAIKLSSSRGDIVVDFFAGSGTTMAAAVGLDRVTRMVELSPNYCDVIISRWESLTGGKAVLRGS